jgi:arylsulfatase A-like enzyme
VAYDIFIGVGEMMLSYFIDGSGRMRVRAGLGLLMGLLLCLSCGGGEPRLNLLLIGVDTLRPDHLGCYGYDRNTSPYIDELAERGVLFENVVAPSPWTLPSFATVFTSLYPSQHGANGSRSALRENIPTLASILQANGYATGAVVNAPYLKAHHGVDRGFDTYYMTPPEGRTADGTTRDALEWIDKHRDRPFFMFAHYFDPHIPYEPPAPYDTLFDPEYTGRIRSPYNPRGLPRFRDRGFEQMESLSEADWNRIRSLYDGEIAFTDKAVGDLLKGLDERGLSDNTLIVFLSDHGEEFFEHHGFEHGHSLYDELIKVPMIFSLPGVLPEKTRVARQVRLLDVEPTLLDMLGLAPWTEPEGVSILPLMTGAGDLAFPGAPLLPPEIGLSEAILYGGERKSLSAYPWKLIYSVKEDSIAFFNLADDPGEIADISGEATEALSLLEQTLYRTMFDISDTWFLEIAGGDKPHVFDLYVTSEAVRGAGHFRFHKIIDSDGKVLDTDALGEAAITPSVVEIRNLKVKEPVTLAFQLMQTNAPIEFTLQIDGRPAPQSTFIGEDLSQPMTMPFTEKAPPPDTDTATLDNPTTRPPGPYCLLWLRRSQYQEESAITLDEETKRELRAVGYIQ